LGGLLKLGGNQQCHVQIDKCLSFGKKKVCQIEGDNNLVENELEFPEISIDFPTLPDMDDLDWNNDDARSTSDTRNNSK
jgi:hypothetical protein